MFSVLSPILNSTSFFHDIVNCFFLNREREKSDVKITTIKIIFQKNNIPETMMQNPESTDVLVKLLGKNRFICFYVKGFFVCSDFLVVGVGI